MSSGPSIPIPFAIGEPLWLAEASHDFREFPCPVCAGKRVVRVVLGDGEMVSVDCGGCERRCLGPTGVCRESRYTFSPRPFTPRRVDVRGDEVTYSESPPTASGFTFYHIENLFRTREECEARCAERAAEQEREIDESNARSRKPKGKGGSVDIHAYYVTRRDELRRRLAYIEAKLARKAVTT